MAENPKVTSKFDRAHGHPRKPGKVAKPGGYAAVSGTHQSDTNAGLGAKAYSKESDSEGARINTVHYAPDDHGRMHNGEHAVDPGYGKLDRGTKLPK